MGVTDCFPGLILLLKIESWIGLVCVCVYTTLALFANAAIIEPYAVVAFTFHLGILFTCPFLEQPHLILSAALFTAWAGWHTIQQIPVLAGIWDAPDCPSVVYAIVIHATLCAVLMNGALVCLHAFHTTAVGVQQHARFMRLLRAPRRSLVRFGLPACGRAPAA